MQRLLGWTGWLVAGLLLATTPIAAEARDLITGGDIQNGSLTGKDVDNGSLAGRDVENRSIERRDLARSVRPARTEFFELYAFAEGANGGPTSNDFALAKRVPRFTLVEAVDLHMDWSTQCTSGEAVLRLGEHVIGSYELREDGTTSEILGAGATGAEARDDLRLDFTCTAGNVAGTAATVTYQQTRRSLDGIQRYEG